MVEAAFIFPIVIVAVATVFTTTTIFYENVSTQAENHTKEREKAMENGEINKKEADFIRNIDFWAEGIKQ